MPSINDDFADAIEVVINTNGGTYTSPPLDTDGNTTESGEPVVGSSANVSAWWKYTPTATGTATFDTELSTVTTTGTDTYMAIYTGTMLTDLVNVAADDDSGSTTATSKITNLAVTSGTTYYIQVGGFGNQTMNLVMRVTGMNTVGATGTDATITVPGPATATADAVAPATIVGESTVTGGGPATATAAAPAPTVSGTSGGLAPAVADTVNITDSVVANLTGGGVGSVEDQLIALGYVPYIVVPL
jgi:hypothetical protein